MTEMQVAVMFPKSCTVILFMRLDEDKHLVASCMRLTCHSALVNHLEFWQAY